MPDIRVTAAIVKLNQDFFRSFSMTVYVFKVISTYVSVIGIGIACCTV